MKLLLRHLNIARDVRDIFVLNKEAKPPRTQAVRKKEETPKVFLSVELKGGNSFGVSVRSAARK